MDPSKLTEYCKPGEWTKSLDNAKIVGQKNNRFILINWGKSTECGFCNTAWDYVFSQKKFLDWSKNNDIPICCIDDCTNWTVSNWIHDTYYGGKVTTFPQMVILDSNMGTKDKPKCIARILYQGSCTVVVKGGYDSCSPMLASRIRIERLDCPNFYYIKLTPSDVPKMLRFIFSELHNQKKYAREISIDEKIGAYNDYDVRFLGCQNYWTSNNLTEKIGLITHSSSQFHWFKFKGKAGKAYKILVSDYIDTDKCGKCLIFFDETAAENATTYQNALKRCQLQFDMSGENIIFTPKQDGWTYILFTRKDDVREEFASTKGTIYKGYHEFDLTYTFVVTNSDTVYSGVTFFDYDGSTLKETQLVEYGKNAVPPPDPTRSMFKFTGWNPDYRNVRTDLSCYAQYRKIGYQNPRTVSEVNRDSTLFAYQD